MKVGHGRELLAFFGGKTVYLGCEEKVVDRLIDHIVGRHKQLLVLAES